MKFTLHCKTETGGTAIYYYDNANGLLFDNTGHPVGEPRDDLLDYVPAFKADPVKNPIRKSRNVRTLKIQLGLSCNYSCKYCLQRFVPGADETSKKHVDGFLENLRNSLTSAPQNIQLWGGEPLVYIKTLRPLVEGLRAMYPAARFSMITNGSLLTREINDWIMQYGIDVSVSHDGPGQSVRGPDPFDDPKTADAIRDLYWRMKHSGKNLGFGAMIHAQNMDRAAVYKWLSEKIGDDDIWIGEGAVIEVYDEGAKENSFTSHDDRLAMRRLAFNQIADHSADRFIIVGQRMNEWLNSMQQGRMLDSLGMKCGMDQRDVVTVDLEGNVVTCQNINRSAVAPNGQSHLGGTLQNLPGVEIKSSTHFMHRDHCHGCPVVQACKGGCMYLAGDLFYASCNNTFTDHISFFAAAVEMLTGAVPVYIEDDAGKLPEERRDIFGYGKPK
jgi:uncharacterized protein